MPTRALLRVSTAVVTMLTLVVCVVCTLQTTQFACADGTTQVMYRLYNPNSGEHFYTADVSERDAVAAAGWSYEGEGWTAPTASSMPVYRLYSGTDHHYCTGEGEKDALVAAGWSYEGIGWYSDDAKGVPLYRQFNPNVDPTAPVNNSGSHNYTTSLDEHNYLVSIGWNDEGIGWYGVDTNTGTTVPMEPAKQPNPAGDFEYAVGNYWTYDEVHTESVAGLANTDGNYKKNKYGCGFTCSWDDGRDGCTGIDAGYGVYVTGITRKVQDVVVPDEIDGIPVVFVSLPAEYDEYYDDFESYSLRTDEDELQACATYVDDDAYITSIDVSQCQSLKYMECKYNGIDYPVEFGTINNLTEVKITGLGKNTRMDMSKQTRLGVRTISWTA